ncbi:unnamed protein product [Cylindrotheca closterium]|uniref:Smr domain-containing protein n=1 Tax=Cylindrotheca closterium TaxID=2856 RepID=A0AAD2CMY7_9STRA|nr:unnamed protein product [Cylindrotheca closterium]
MFLTSRQYASWKKLSDDIDEMPESKRIRNRSTKRIYPKSRPSDGNFQRAPQRKINDRFRNPNKGGTQRSGYQVRTPEAFRNVYASNTPDKINRWMKDIYDEQTNQSLKDKTPNPFASLSSRDEINFVKLLQSKQAYESILLFVQLGNPDVKVFTTAIFALALSRGPYRQRALDVLPLMDQQKVEPTSLTLIALLGSLDGPNAVSELMRTMERRGITMTTEVFNSAIYAICRTPWGQSTAENSDFQVALNLFQKMKAKRIQPSSKTYHALLQVLAKTGKVDLAIPLLRQWKMSPIAVIRSSDFVWLAAMHVCAQASDCDTVIQLAMEMQEMGCSPTLRHCSALLRAFARAGNDKLAFGTLQLMLGDVDTVEIGNTRELRLPRIAPDLVALNTVIKSCAKAGNFEGASLIFQRMKAGEFFDPDTHYPISPDLITFHSMLQSCRDANLARDIVREIRFSRRNRFGAVTPTNVTYAHAINVCQKADTVDLKLVDLLLGWAKDDSITPSVFMYASAIWAAHKSGNCEKALGYFNAMESAGCIPNAVAFDGLISALGEKGDFEEAVKLYERTRGLGNEVSPATMMRLASSIQSVSNPDEREEFLTRVFEKMSDQGHFIDFGGAIFEALINLYGSQGRFDEALLTFDAIVGPINGACLRSILLSCSTARPPRWMEAITIMHTSDVVESASGPGKVDQVALSNAVIACSKADEFEEGLTLLNLYGDPESSRNKSYSSISVSAIDSLIAACSRGNRPDLAISLFNEMSSAFGVQPDERTYRNAIMTCNRAEHKARYEEKRARDTGETYSSIEWWEVGLALFRRMKEEGVKPDVKVYSSVISACQAAGEWQRALGILENLIEESVDRGDVSLLNTYCFNSAISACEKGGAWVEALDLYERMVDIGGSIRPNFVTVSSLILALDKAGQKDLAQSKFEEGVRKRIVKPWRWTQNDADESIYALDLHNFSAAMAKAAVRSCMDSYFFGITNRMLDDRVGKDLVIITGKGLHTRSTDDPILQQTTLRLLQNEYGVSGAVKESNQGRVIVNVAKLKEFVTSRS